MAKKLTAKSIRQGQTVYTVSDNGLGFRLFPIYITSSTARKLIAIHADEGNFVTRSRRKAISKAKELNRMVVAV